MVYAYIFCEWNAGRMHVVIIIIACKMYSPFPILHNRKCKNIYIKMNFLIFLNWLHYGWFSGDDITSVDGGLDPYNSNHRDLITNFYTTLIGQLEERLGNAQSGDQFFTRHKLSEALTNLTVSNLYLVLTLDIFMNFQFSRLCVR